jgi:hypothetical protein
VSRTNFGNLGKMVAPTVKPVESCSCWRDDRPQPNSAHHGVYTPVLNTARRDNGPFGYPGQPMQAIKKPRGTV